jgi:chromosome segregation ATPase
VGLRSWFEATKAKLDAAAVEQRRRTQERDAAIARKREEDRRGEALMVEMRAKWAADDAKGADGRLQEHYDALQEGEITLEEYKDEIEAELAKAKGEIETLREFKKTMDRDDYEIEREKADEDLEAARWRLGWVKDQIREQGDRPTWMEKSGKWARFEYADSDGVVTRQEISMWKAYSQEVRGWDRKLKREVGFSFGGISDWVAG